MIDYTAAGFTLLQGAHLYAPEDRGICDVLVANGKLSPLPAISLLTLYRTARLSISVGRSSAQVLLINTSI
ncbi:isoaspartyl dipeptidase [Escherichia coli]|nr:isoaspartyl dipeptidase [Escherichia coli]